MTLDDDHYSSPVRIPSPLMKKLNNVIPFLPEDIDCDSYV